MSQFASPPSRIAPDIDHGSVQPPEADLFPERAFLSPGSRKTSRKIVLYIHALAGGGAERVWAVLATGLARVGHDVVLAVDYDATENMSFVSSQVRVVTLGGGNLKSTIRLSKLLQAEKPDLSISALSSANLKHVAAALLAGRLRRCVITYHGYFSNERGFLSRIGYLATPLLTRMAAQTIAVSSGLAKYLLGQWRASAPKIRMIYNPVQASPAQACNPAGRGPIVLAVGRLDRAKDHATLLNAFAKVRTPGARLIILGEGAERAALDAQIKRLDLSGRVDLLGYTNETSKYFSQVDCFVMPSKVEAFGISTVEALAYGANIVATDCDGSREILSDPELGVIVPVGDAEAMARAIEDALQRERQYERRHRRASDFSVGRAIQNYDAFIEEMTSLQVVRAPKNASGPAPVIVKADRYGRQAG